MSENEISRLIVEISLKVHRKLGPGLLESVYELIFCHEWEKTMIPFKRQVSIPVTYGDIVLDAGFRADIIIDDRVLIEIKSVETISNVHFKQVQTYLKLTGLKLGLLINFNTALIKDGIKRIVNGF